MVEEEGSPEVLPRCGRSPPHDRQSCPARDSTCHKCSKSVCRSSSKVSELHEDAKMTNKFLGGLNSNEITNNPWRLTIDLNEVPTEFDIDTGAEVSVERLGVIARVNIPTEWCAGMVVVPKPNSMIRICVDLTKLNQSVCREQHPLPAVEQTLAQLAGA